MPLYLFIDFENKLTFSSVFSMCLFNPSMKSTHILLSYPTLLFVVYDYVWYIFLLAYFVQFFLIFPGAKINKTGP